LSFYFGSTSGVRNLLGFLFRGFSKNSFWYVIGILVPVAAVASAIIIARHLDSAATFIPLAALPLTLGLQVFTGAMGEELGWRGFLLSHLERRLSPRVAALVMAITWALWHLPAFFFPGMPQQHVPPIAFLLMVAAFGIFLALLFNRTRGHLVSTMLAHFSFNMSLAAGGAILGCWLTRSNVGFVAINSAEVRRDADGTTNIAPNTQVSKAGCQGRSATPGRASGSSSQIPRIVRRSVNRVIAL
jgi:membrane protease YdiL (CAAX protease family)